MAGQPASGDEAILIVEDDPLVRLTLRHYLEQSGYRVLEAGDAAAALAICEGPIALLIADVSLPGMSGPALARKAAENISELPVLFVSGSPSDMIEQLPPDAEVLQKPFTSEALVARVQSLLARRR